MFLSQLVGEQKQLFLELTIKAAEANDEVTNEEYLMIEAFAKEMQVEPIYKTDKDLRSILKRFKEISDDRDYKVVMIELLAILFSDTEYDKKEQEFISNVSEELGISKSTIIDMTEAVREYGNSVRKLTNIVMG